MEHYRYIVVKLEAARDERGMTVAELARRSDIPRKRLWYILDGQRQLRADELVRLCIVLGMGIYQIALTPVSPMRQRATARKQL